MCPAAPRKPCRKPGCNVLGITSYCQKHTRQKKSSLQTKQRQYDNLRGTRTERMYDNRWLRASKHFRKGKVCVGCEQRGIVKMSECTDHIIPHKGDSDLFWDKNNWQPLCISCNTEKGDTPNYDFLLMK